MKSGYDGQSEFALSKGAKKLEEEILREFSKTLMRGFMAGFAAGLSDSVVEVLDARGLKMDAKTSEQIYACKKLDELKALLRKAVTVSSAQELFEAGPG